MASLEALKAAGAKNLQGKVLIDVANPLDFSKGMPPTLSVCNTDSLGEQIQRASRSESGRYWRGSDHGQLTLPSRH